MIYLGKVQVLRGGGVRGGQRGQLLNRAPTRTESATADLRLDLHCIVF